MIRLPAPAVLNGAQLAAEIEAAGFTSVRVCLVDDSATVEIAADGFADRTAPADQRAACADSDALRALEAQCAADADTRNASAIQTITPIVANHVPAQ